MKYDYIKALIRDFDKYISDIILFIVCNTKTKTPILQNHMQYDVSTEFLSDLELEEIFQMINSLNIDARYFYSEESFMKHILHDKDNLLLKNILVYNSAQNGIGAGRKSLIPAFCNLEMLTFTGSDPYVVSLCRHKFHIKSLLRAASIPVPRCWLYNDGWLFSNEPLLGLKVIAKPIYESASIGINESSVFEYDPKSTNYIKERSLELSQPIIIEEFINGHEVEVPVISGKEIIAFPPVGLTKNVSNIMDNEFLTYQDIYNDRYIFYNFSRFESVNISNCSKKVVHYLGMKGLCRVDYRIKENGEFFITDVSTNPHFISHSSVQFALNNLGINKFDIMKIIIMCALKH